MISVFSTSCYPIADDIPERGQLGNLSKEQLPGVEALQTKGKSDDTISNRKSPGSTLMRTLISRTQRWRSQNDSC